MSNYFERAATYEWYKMIFMLLIASAVIRLTPHICYVAPKEEPVVEAPIQQVVDTPVEIPVIEEPVIEEPEGLVLTDEEIKLIALVVMAEAEGECEEGKRLVIDVILNRIESERFPDTAKGVIYAKGQFTSMWNGRVDRCHVKKDICQMVEEETKVRLNREVLYFRADHYHSFGTPVINVGNHYFSTT